MNTQNDKSSIRFSRGSKGAAAVLVLLGCVNSGTALAASAADTLIVEQAPVSYESDRQLSLHRPELSAVPALEHQAAVQPETGGAAKVEAAVTNAPAEQDGNYIVSASIDPEQYALPGKVHVGEAADNNAAASRESSAGKDDRPVPYALVLALIALVSLVPVSRRRNF